MLFDVAQKGFLKNMWAEWRECAAGRTDGMLQRPGTNADKWENEGRKHEKTTWKGGISLDAGAVHRGRIRKAGRTGSGIPDSRIH